jgi:hypothetical protein
LQSKAATFCKKEKEDVRAQTNLRRSTSLNGNERKTRMKEALVFKPQEKCGEYCCEERNHVNLVSPLGRTRPRTLLLGFHPIDIPNRHVCGDVRLIVAGHAMAAVHRGFAIVL